jgi:hypothetical protein
MGHKVSHSNIKTKRRLLLNLCNVTLISDAPGRSKDPAVLLWWESDTNEVMPIPEASRNARCRRAP